MPLARFELRSEYGLGDSELYRHAARKEEARPLLDGVAVAGLAGVLRQLGDLAEFAADMFHDLHEAVITTASRGRKVLTRVQNIEAALPSIEKAVKSQTSHIHFAYVAGSNWHGHHKVPQNTLLSSDLPRFMMDVYEECRDPPRLFLLDKYDNAGAGACMKRYSDPSYFKRTWYLSNSKEGLLMANESDKVKRKPSRLGSIQIYQSNRSIRTPEEDQPVLSAEQANRSFDSSSAYAQSFREIKPPPTPDVHYPESVTRSSSGSKASLSFVDKVADKKHSAFPGDSSPAFGSKASLSFVDKISDKKHLTIPDEISFNAHELSMPCVVIDSSSMPQNVEPAWIGDLKHDILLDEREHRSPSNSQHEDIGNDNFKHDILVDNREDMSPSDSSHGDVGNDDFNHEAMVHQKEHLSPSTTEIGIAKTMVPTSPEHHSEVVLSSTDEEIADANMEITEIYHADVEHESLQEVHLEDTRLRSLSSVPSNFEEVTSEADNYLDALNTLESETETEAEGQAEKMGKHVPASCSGTDEVDERASQALGSPLIGAVDASSSSVPEDITSLSWHMATSESSGQLPVSLMSGKLTNLSESSPNNAPRNDIESVNSSSNSTSGRDTAHTISHAKETGLGNPMDRASATQNAQPNTSTVTVVTMSKAADASGKIMEDSFDGDVISHSSNVRSLFNSNSVENTSAMQNSPLQMSSASTAVTSSKLWTNAGLFGLEPAKPPVSAECGDSNGPTNMGSQHPAAPVSVEETIPNGNAFIGYLPRFVIQSCPIADQALTAQPDLARSFNELASSSYHQNDGNIGKHVHARQFENSFENPISISSSFSSIAQRFLANTLQRKTLLYGSVPEPSGKVEPEPQGSTEYSPLGNTRAVANGTSHHTGYLIPVTSSHYSSGQSSPPLECMKISFHPMNASASKTTSKFSNGDIHGSIDADELQTVNLPSFTQQEHGSDSEGDTFCRSYSYSSNDDLSPWLYSNSELWDQDGVCFEEHELYDDNYRLNSSFGSEQINFANVMAAQANGINSYESATLVELPTLDSMSINGQQNGTIHGSLVLSMPNLVLEEESLTPPPPPLPPVQWRRTAAAAGVLADERSKSPPPLRNSIDQEQPIPPAPLSLSELLNDTKEMRDQKIETAREQDGLSSMVKIDGNEEMLQQCIVEINSMEEMFQQIRDQHDQRTNDGIGKEKPKRQDLQLGKLDEREQLLHQIKSKTFSLRRTATSKQSSNSQGAANSGVTAILEKANAIRQAVGSDDGGDDDNWSDV